MRLAPRIDSRASTAQVAACALVVALAGCTAGRVETFMDAGGGGGIDATTARRDGAPGVDGGGAGGPDAAGGDDDGGGSGDRDAGPTGRREADCTDGVDDDGDGDADCADADCDAQACGDGLSCIDFTCGGCTGASVESACGDGRDEDCDTLVDCADPDCDAQVCGPGDVLCAGSACPCASGFEERLCGDGTDDDCDGNTDCADPDCLGRACGSAGEVCLGGECTCPGAGSAEMVCDGADDNCSGTVDEGCPDGIDACCASNLPLLGGPTGTPWADACPTGAALVGIKGRANTSLDQIQPVCAALIFEVDETTRPEHTFSVRRGAAFDGATHGGDGGSPFEDLCPGNEVVIGVSGRGEVQVDAITLQCGSLAIRRTGGFDWTLTVTPTGTTPTRGGAGGEPYSAECPGGGVITGMNGRAGARVSQLTFTCRRLTVSLR